ncbi:efflux RND transporter periplasmic adaptor subunit [Aliikangiella coralliicola]|uniref:Efflux RND transporter periplasmic adaptor subunit n=1 Tax=Aliikangiella coralliicola TaxID=2592383 RepID=A0A545U0B8_9GAMM|nr:efflux RND transporter periplasmic adaptor subunit [Aliikangiella coralliicola]TQV82910.1 efflux RND transporter periplasmic adaptor subunit [Aliikangiella coralliicola]
MKTSTSTFKKTTSLFKLALISSILSTSMLITACSDDSAKDDKQASSEQSKKDDKKNKNDKKDDKKQTDKTAEAEDKKDGKGKDKKKEKPPIPVEVVTVSRGNIQQTYRTITTLEAEQDAQVVARSTGLLQNILVEEGDEVTKGQLLAQLDVEQLALEVAQLEATTKKLKKELERQQTLFNRKLGSSDALDRARFEYQAQQAQFKLSKLKLNYASIKAPIDGVITERMVKPGNLIRDNDILFKIVNPSSLKAVLHLPEKELSNVKKEQRILLSVDAFENKIITGLVERIRPSIDTDTGTFKVVANLNNEENLLKSGMFGKVEVVFDVHENTLLLEQQTIVTQDNRSHVFVVKDNKAIQTPIVVGFRHDGMVEVLDGLAESDQVISTGQQILKHETLVEIVGQEEQVAEKQEAKSPGSVAVNP